MKVFFVALLSVVCVSVCGQSFAFDKDLSRITFSIKNFGVTVKGEFHQASGECFVTEENIHDSYFNASVDAATIETGIGLRDKHLKKEDYFDAERFPKITIVSKQITRKGDQWSAVATITIKEISREVTINFKVEKRDNTRVLSGTFGLNRLDFGVGQSSFSLADEVVVVVRVVGIEDSKSP